MTAPPAHVLDNPVWHALAGPQAHVAERHGRALRYRPDVSVFAALPDRPDEAAWADLAALAGPERVTILFRRHELALPAGWEVLERYPGVQMLAGPAAGPAATDTDADTDTVALGEPDLDDMLALVEQTRPGPFQPATHTLGAYVGVRQQGRLVALAGERMRPPGHTEVSAVCTDPDLRGQGLATRLVQRLVDDIHARGEVPFLHALVTNTSAIRLYDALGFRERCRTTAVVLQAPRR